MASTTQPRRIWLRSSLLISAVILGLLAWGAAVGLIMGSGRGTLTLLFLALPLGAIALYLVLHRFELLVLALPLTALAVPTELPTGTESTLPISMVLAIGLTGVWCFSMALRGWQLKPSGINRPLLWFAAVCIFSLVWGVIWRDPVLQTWSSFPMVQVASLISFLVSFSAALLIGNFVTTTGQLKYIVGAFIFFGALMALTQFLHVHQGVLNDRGLWALWVVAPCYGLLIALPRLRWRWRVVLLAIILLTFYQTLIVESLWISGWAPGIVAIVAVTFLHSRKGFLALVLVGAIAIYLSQGFFQQVADDNVQEGSLERIGIWEQSWGLTKQHWLFGTGPAGYAIYYMTYYKDDARSTHNNYLDILAQFGFVGMAIWIWFVVASVWEGWKLTQRAPPGFLRAVAIIATGGWVGAMAAMFFGDWILPFAYNQTIAGYRYTVYSWLFLGMLISVRHLLDSPAAMPAPAEVEI